MKRGAGLTLIEILVVLGVLAIFLTLGISSYISYRQNLTTREAANQLAGHLLEARNKARRTSTSYEFRFTKGGNSYLVGPVGDLRAYTLPGNSTLDSTRTGDTISIMYTAPYSTTPDGNTSIEVRGPGGKRLLVNVVGYMGKVVVRAP